MLSRQDLFRLSGSGSRVQEFRNLGVRVQGFRVQGFWDLINSGISGSVFRHLGVRVQGSGFRG